MFNALTEAIKKRIILELRRFWSYDPNYRDDLVHNIVGRYSFKDRPCTSIIIKNSSANTVQLSADNFQGTVVSYVSLEKVANYAGLSIEWVREDIRAISENGGVFPTARGIYYIAVEQETIEIQGQSQERLVFYVDPLLEAVDETPNQLSPLVWQLQNGSYHDGSLRLFELPGQIALMEGENYSADPSTGEITLVTPLPAGTWLSADYRYPGTSTGPYVIRENHTNVEAIPGVVLAFGRRVEAGDRQAVLVGDRRQAVALEYGGRWEINLDIDVMARDIVAQGEICDRTVMYLWGVARNRLSSEGIEITTVNFGGESEEIYDETGDDYFYNGSISMTLMSDWAIHVPISATIRQVVPLTEDEIERLAGLSDDQLIDEQDVRFKAVADLGLRSIRDPFFLGRSRTYEVIR